MAQKANDIAQFILTLSSPEVGDIISNLKLQKLLYYTQGFYLAINDHKLFEEDIYAWQYGPVVPDVYHQYKQLGSAAIPIPENINIELDTKTQELIKEIYNVYGQFSALKLMDMTHSETPWKETPINNIIEPEIMKNYFKNLVISD